MQYSFGQRHCQHTHSYYSYNVPDTVYIIQIHLHNEKHRHRVHQNPYKSTVFHILPEMTTPVRLYPPFKSYTILHNPHALPVIPAYNRTVIVKEARTLAEVSFLIPSHQVQFCDLQVVKGFGRQICDKYFFLIVWQRHFYHT